MAEDQNENLLRTTQISPYGEEGKRLPSQVSNKHSYIKKRILPNYNLLGLQGSGGMEQVLNKGAGSVGRGCASQKLIT